MTAIVAHFTNQGTPLTSPTDAPTIRIRRTDTGALVVTDLAMTELGDGSFRRDFSPASTLQYAIRADGDPTASGQVTVAERYVFGSLDGRVDNSLVTVIPTNLDATISSVASAIAALNDLSQADVQSAMTSQGYTVARAALLDNLDAAISSLNDLSIADVQTALTNQGYTAARAPNLDNLDAAISTVIAAIAALNDLSIADVQTALTNQGYTVARAANLDNLDAPISGIATLTIGDVIAAIEATS